MCNVSTVPFPSLLPTLNAKKGFERGLYSVIKWSQAKVNRIENGSLQRYAFVMIVVVLCVLVGHCLRCNNLRAQVN